MKKYDHKKIEKKWQKYWEENSLHKRGENGDKYYVLDMFPYPSGDGLHMGHTESYTSTDIIYRYKKLRGFNVLHPQGFDSFGLPAENYAIKTGVRPKETTKKNIKNYIEQMKSLGFGYDFDEKIVTSDPNYYKWTQWIFGKFFEAGLVYKKTDTINWCPSCHTGIANEQVENGKCERCKTEVIQKEVPGWFFKITDFADDLINDLEKVDWPEATKKNQINWVGKSEGALIKFSISNSQFSNNDQLPNDGKILRGRSVLEEERSDGKRSDLKEQDFEDRQMDIEVFTTRPDTLFGATYMVLAPEHVLISNLKSQISNLREVEEYIEATRKKSEMDRIESKEKTGIKLEGVFAINPANKEEIPIYIADYVLSGYGAGAIMAVPAHDERDWEFAKKYNLPIIEVVSGSNPEEKAYMGDGDLVNSGKFDGMTSEEAKKKITKFVGGEMTSNYRLRDWSVSRQRYWGCPIPMVYDPDGKAHYVGDENLPWKLPEDVDFVPTGEAPLVKSKEFKKRTEKIFGEGWVPEVDTLDTFVDSAWYFLRYPDPKNEKEITSVSRQRYWLPVDIYIGGAEHTYMHLLYARFFVKALKGIGVIDFGEPFVKLRHQGMVLDKEGVKMSKSKGNVVNPDEMVEKFGADAVRLYMMFAGPLEDDVVWDEKNITGVSRFLEKVWRTFNEKELVDCGSGCGEIPKELPLVLHKTIKKVTEDIEGVDFNTAISSMMIFINEFSKHDRLPRAAMERFLILLSPFAPHISEELWNQLGHDKSIFLEKWPEHNESKIKEDNFKLVVQVNGKVRETIDAPIDISKEDAEKIALKQEGVKKWIDIKKDYKVIFVPNKLINIVDLS